MIQLEDLKICENCGNAFARIIRGEVVNRCPACSMEKGKQRRTDLKIYDQIKRLLHIFLHHNLEKKHYWWNEK